MGTQSSSLQPPPVPIRTAFVDAQGMLTKEGYWFLYQLFMGARQAEGLAILEAFDSGTETALLPEIHQLSVQAAAFLESLPGITPAQIDEIKALASMDGGPGTARQQFEEVRALTEVPSDISLRSRLDDLERWVALFNDQASSTSASASQLVTTPTGSGTGQLNGQGLPSQGVVPPPDVPQFAVLPAVGGYNLGDRVVVPGVGGYELYTLTAPLSGAGANFWSVDPVHAPTIRDTFANLGSYAAASYAVGTVFFATDKKVSYTVQIPSPANVKTWVYSNGIWEDTLANLPAGLGVNDTGLLFRASDYFHNYYWTGTVFSWIEATKRGMQAGLMAGTTNFSPSGAPFGGTSQKWHLCDGSVQNLSQDNGTVAAQTLQTIALTYMVL